MTKQRQNQQDPEKQKLFQQRKAIAEPLFGVIKKGWRFRQWAACGGGGFVSINQSSGTLPGTSALTISGTYQHAS